MSKKVLYLCPNGYLGGAERFVVETNKAHINSQKIDSEILFFQSGAAFDKAKEYGIKVHLFGQKFRMGRPLQLIKAIVTLRKFLKNSHYDVIHSTMPYIHILASLATIGLNQKIVWFQHGPVGNSWDFLANIFGAEQIYFNTRYLQNEHNKMPVQFFGSNNQFIVNYGINETPSNSSSVEDIKKQFSPNGETLILCAGRICPWKGYETAIEAYARLLKQGIGNNAQMLVVGDVGREEDQPYFEFLKDLVKKKDLENRVHFLGYQNNLQDFFKACDIFLHTSLIPEPFGLVVAEAMLQDCLVIGSGHGGTQDILINNSTGLAFDSIGENRVDELQVQLKKALTRPSHNLVINAKEHIQKHYSLSQVNERLESLYSQIN